MKRPSDLDKHHGEQWLSTDEAFFARVPFEPSMYVVKCENWALRDEKMEEFMQRYAAYEHSVLDLNQEPNYSLVTAFSQQLPAQVLGDNGFRHMVHVVHLENVFLKQITEPDGDILATLEAENMAIPYDFPFTIILWTDFFMGTKLKKKALEFWKHAEAEMSFYSEIEETPIKDHETLNSAVELFNSDAGEGKRAAISVEIGQIFQKRKMRSQATLHYQRALEYNQFEQDTMSSSQAYEGIGDILHYDDDYYQAIECYQYASEGFVKEGMDERVGEIWAKIGHCHLFTANVPEAISSYENALRVFEENDMILKQGEVHFELGKLQNRASQLPIAIEHFDRAIQSFMAHEQYESMAHCYHQKGLIHKKQSQWYPAREELEQAISFADRSGKKDLAETLEDLLNHINYQINPESVPPENHPKPKKDPNSMGRRGFLNKFLGRKDD